MMVELTWFLLMIGWLSIDWAMLYNWFNGLYWFGLKVKIVGIVTFFILFDSTILV